MKKLMFACVAVAMAAVTHGATINWTITNVYSPSDSTAKAATGSATALLFVTANTTDVTTGIPVTTLAAVQSALAAGDFAGLSSLAAVNKTNNALGGFTGATGLTGFSSGSLTAFAVVFDSDDISKANNYYFVSGGAEKTATFTSATGAKPLAWGDQTSITQAAGAWTSTTTSVPEPTSGLLMLLGMAGLALRRKRA